MDKVSELRSEVKAELPPNWFNSNFLGFALSLVIFFWFHGRIVFEVDVSFDWTYSDNSSSVDIITSEFIFFKRTMESGHVCLFYVPLPKLSNCSQVTGIKVSYKTFSMESRIEIKRCGVGLVYSNEDENHNNPPMIQFDSISSPPLPPIDQLLSLKKSMRGIPVEMGALMLMASKRRILKTILLMRRKPVLQLPALRITPNQICGHRNA